MGHPSSRADRHFRRAVTAWLAAPVAVGLLTLLARLAGANATAAGVLYLVVVVGVAAWGGWQAGVVASLLATVCLDLFFIPPFGRLTIADPGDVAALVSFLAAAVLSGRLVARARRQAEEADVRRREVEILYELSFSLFTATQREGSLGEAAARTLSALGARSGVLQLSPSPGAPSGATHVIGDVAQPLDRPAVERARDLRSILEVGPAGEERIVYLPLLVGGLLAGVLVARGTPASRKVLESAGRLLALAVERERLLATAAHLAAVRASESLKTSLLRAVSHDLRTPLTAMQLGLEGLHRNLQENAEAAASFRDVAREQERLTRRIDNLLALARLEAGVAQPHPEDVQPGELFRTARESLALVLGERPVEVRVDRECPDLWADPALAVEIVVNLLENAARAAPPDLPLELAAGPDPDDPASVRLEVLDRGPGLPMEEKRSGGLGLLIASGLATANGGTLALLDRPGGGTIARLILPAAPTLGETA
jgi:two-component system sensor histidine kinase KdpD